MEDDDESQYCSTCDHDPCSCDHDYELFREKTYEMWGD